MVTSKAVFEVMAKKKQRASAAELKSRLLSRLASQRPVDDFPVRVQLNVGGEESMAREVLGRLTHELSSVGDVVVSEMSPRFKIFASCSEEIAPMVLTAHEN